MTHVDTGLGLGESVRVSDAKGVLAEGIPARFKTALTRVVDAVLPPSCLSCGAPVDEAGALCGACWKALHFLESPLCECCGLPLEGAGAGDMLCGGCIADRPLYRRARAVLGYDDASRKLVSRFKYRDRTELAESFAGWMARAGRGLMSECDLIAPVPLHSLRLLMRRFNQAALLALSMGRRSGVPVVPDLLRRVRFTPPQVGLSAEARRRNVAHVFRLRARHAEQIKDLRILLVDDVLTTGATAEACARVLLRSGAAAVDVLTLARVVTPRRPIA
jgi:ComF family protein